MDVTRQSDGAMIDELDIGGPAHQEISADGTQIDHTLVGASVTLHVTLDPETGTTTALTGDVDAKLIDLCTLLDRAAHHGVTGDDGHHGVTGDDGSDGDCRRDRR